MVQNLYQFLGLWPRSYRPRPGLGLIGPRPNRGTRPRPYTSEFAGATQSFGMPATVLDPYTRVLASVADGKDKDKCLSIIVEMSSLHNCRTA